MFALLVLAAFFAASVCVDAQEVGGELITELHTDFRNNYVFMGQLRMHAELPLGKSVRLKGATVSFAKTANEPLVNDLQVYSNIDADNLPLALTLAGVEWSIDERSTLFFGIHNVNEDCFTSDVTSLFVNSSCGIYPTIACNYPIANYPVASVGMHYKYVGERWGLVASVYNGTGYNRFSGRENVFRFCPKSDGVFAVLQGEYKHRGSHYFVGASAHYGELYEIDGKRMRSTLWTYAEQRLCGKVDLIGGYSHAFDGSSPCTDFVGLGGRVSLGNVEAGIFADYVHFKDNEECGVELTCKTQLNRFCYLQPALHYIKNHDINAVVGMVRLGVEF